MRTENGFLVLSKRQPRPNEGVDIYLAAEHVGAIEPHRMGCYVYAAGQKWDVAHSHGEIMQAIREQKK